MIQPDRGLTQHSTEVLEGNAATGCDAHLVRAVVSHAAALQPIHATMQAIPTWLIW